MLEVKVKNNRGELLNLTTSKNYTLYKIEGLQPPEVTINSSNKSTSDGITINNVSVESRNIVLYMAIEGNVERNRINLYKYFPLKQKVTIYFKNNTRDVYIEGYVEVIECDFFAEKQVAQISLICPQPYFNGVELLTTYFSDVDKLFEFPFNIDSSGTEFSRIVTNIRKSIINVGDVESGVIIKLYAIGEVDAPVIYDVFKRNHLAIAYKLQANDEVIINTQIGKKSITLIRDGVSYNLMGFMTPDSKWLTVSQGDNVFTYDCDSGNSNLQITFTTPVLYGGV